MIDSAIASALIFLTLFGVMAGGAGTIGALANEKAPFLSKLGSGGLGAVGIVIAVAAGGALVLLTLYQWFLLATQGQTIGKRAVGIRIVDAATGKTAGFFQAVLMRTILPILIVSAVTALLGWLFPPIGGLLALFNLVPIFGPDRQCVHDLLASTQVRWVNAKSEQRMKIAYVGTGVLAVGGAAAVVLLAPGTLETLKQLPSQLKPAPAPIAVAPPAPAPEPIAPAPAPVAPAPTPEAAPAPAPAPAPVAQAPLAPGVYSWVDKDGTTSFTNDPSTIPEKYRGSIKKLGE